MPSHEQCVIAAGRLRIAAMLLVALSAMGALASATEAGAGASASASGASRPDAVAAAGAARSAEPPAAAPSADPAAAAAASELTLFLEVEVNGYSTGKVGEFTLRRGKLMARVSELRDLGFLVPEALGVHPSNLIALSDLPGLTWRLDQVNQILYVTTPESQLVPAQVGPDATEARGGHRVIESGTGVTLNYDVVDTLSGGHMGATSSLDVRSFSPLGIVSSQWLAYAGSNSNSSGNNNAIRLDTAYTFADVNTLRRYSVGDFITGGLAWTRPVRLAGVQVRSDFSMRPDLITFPMPAVKGSVAVPSTVNVMADGNQMVSGQVAPGPFEVPQLPVMSGAGTISMTMTNAMGQQVTINQPFYASSALLAPGLHTFSAQAGAVRRDWGSVSNDYGKIAGVASYRRGLTSRLTAEGGMEATSGVFMAGAGGALQIANLGVVNLAASGSVGSANPGGQISVGAQRIARMFSLGGSATIATRAYRDVASMNGDELPRKQLSAFTSVAFRRFGSAGAAYAGVDEDPSPHPLSTSLLTSQHSHVVSADYSLQFHHMAFYASEFRSIDAKGSSGLQVGLTIPFGKRSSVDVSATSDGYAQVQAQQAATQVGEWGYQAYVGAGNSNHEFAQVQYKSQRGLLSGGVDSSAGTTTLRMESQGAVSFADRSLFLSNLIYDSFAVVDTGPMHHVHVLQENRDVGRTGTSGRLLVPDMRSFDLNHITIEATDLPADVTLSDASREVRPQDRSGVVVKFPIKVSHGALLHLVDASGAPLPLGSSARLQTTGVVVPVGYGGEAYVEDLSGNDLLTVELPDGRRCTVMFDYRPVPGEIPSIGPLRCLEQKP